MSKIEWCDLTINPIVGCKKCSPGCDNCYAEKFALRLANHPNSKIREKYEIVVDNVGWNGKKSPLDLTVFEKLPETSKRVFVGSMTDLFEDDSFSNYFKIINILDKIIENKQHTFIILTKRPKNMKEIFDWIYKKNKNKLVENLWLGITCCTHKELEQNLNILLSTLAVKKLISFEPLLEDVLPDPLIDKTLLDQLSKIDWVIIGGETGKNARPMEEEWAKKIVNFCSHNDIPVFFKSWGEFLQNPATKELKRVGKKIADQRLLGLKNISRQFPKI